MSRVATALVVTAVLALGSPTPTALAAPAVVNPARVTPALADTPVVDYRPMVIAEVTDPFRPPATPYGPGNRGLEYDTVPGQAVTAAADGEVTFAGPVAGALHVTVRHADGVLTTASFLASVEVRVGAMVRRGELIGRAASRLHVGVRVDGSYVDPALVFGTHERVPRLVPSDPVGVRALAAERAQLAALTRLEGGGPGPWARVVGAAARITGHGWSTGVLLTELAAALHGAGVAGPGPLGLVRFGTDVVLGGRAGRLLALVHHLVELSPVVRTWRMVGHVHHLVGLHLRCTRADGPPPPPPPGRRVLVLVGGLGSSSDDAAIGSVDVERLGYDPADVIGFSYAGGRTPDRFGVDPTAPAADLVEVGATTYTADDSSSALERRGTLLAALLVDVAAATPPDVTIDLAAHSQGGIVARLALAELAVTPGGAEVIARLGLVATIGSPHRGTPLATSAAWLGATPVGDAALAGLERLAGIPLHPGSTTVGDLGAGAPLLAALDGRAVPAGPHLVSIAGRGDVVVPPRSTRWSGAHHVVVDTTGRRAHDRLPADPGTTRELALGIAGAAPSCPSVLGTLLDLGWAEGIDLALDHLGLVATAWLAW